MPFSRWIIAVAFGLICSASVAQDQTTTENQPRQEESIADGEESAESEQPRAIDPTPALEGIEAAIRDLEAEIDEVEKDRQRKNERRDVEAQEDMARWAFWMFVSTVVVAVITALGVTFVWLTLKETAAGVFVMRHEQRPWICYERYINQGFADSVLGNRRVPYYILIKLVFVNRGSGPALNTAGHFRHLILPANELTPVFERTEPTGEYKMAIGHGQPA